MFEDSETTVVTFRLDAVADQAYLCLQLCEQSMPGDGGTWVTRPLRQDAPGTWESVERLPPGWWRFRYYTAERGACFYAEPTQSVLHMDGLDAMLHVSRVAPDTNGSGGGGLLAQAVASALAAVIPGARSPQRRPRRVARTDVRTGFFVAEPESVDQHTRAIVDVGDEVELARPAESFAAQEWKYAGLC